MIGRRKKEAAPCSLDGAVAASIKLVQNNTLTQFILQTPKDWFQSVCGTISLHHQAYHKSYISLRSRAPNFHNVRTEMTDALYLYQ